MANDTRRITITESARYVVVDLPIFTEEEVAELQKIENERLAELERIEDKKRCESCNSPVAVNVIDDSTRQWKPAEMEAKKEAVKIPRASTDYEPREFD